MRRFEASAGLPVATGAITTGKAAAVRTRLAELWAPALRRRTAALWLVWFCVNFSYYGAFIWLPTILVASGFAWCVVRLHAHHHARAAARLCRIRVSHREVGETSDPGGIPDRRRCLGRALRGGDGCLAGHHRRHAAVVLQPRRLGCAVRGDSRALPDQDACHGRGLGGRDRADRLDPRAAGRAVPARRGGTVFLFGIFAAFFVVAALGAFALPEMRGQALED